MKNIRQETLKIGTEVQKARLGQDGRHHGEGEDYDMNKGRVGWFTAIGRTQSSFI